MSHAFELITLVSVPLAERVLTPDDWADLDKAFGAMRDPLTGCEPDAEYRELFGVGVLFV